jgi:hypothetical protein
MRQGIILDDVLYEDEENGSFVPMTIKPGTVVLAIGDKGG